MLFLFLGNLWRGESTFLGLWKKNNFKIINSDTERLTKNTHRSIYFALINFNFQASLGTDFLKLYFLSLSILCV